MYEHIKPEEPDEELQAVEVLNVLEDVSLSINRLVRPAIDEYLILNEQAQAEVREEHPHWFIENSGTPAKISSRAKKRHYAIEAIIKSRQTMTVREAAGRAINEWQVRSGIASEEQEVDYLEEMLKKETLSD